MKSDIPGNREILPDAYDANVSGPGALRAQRVGIIPWMLITGLVVSIPAYIAHGLWANARFNCILTPILVVADLGYLFLAVAIFLR
ncbi:hypothetical protein FOMPIDRAFT_1055450 [Fomitopsis schrenkii]|uniref:Uncharacterized protein n=1 Tax=Fomitopsis schrenkii TaxID=2126942 RepID=S8DMY2_FOMSC|nr:hypothetical protein FOMPIDRAFT_1055450 [Fomitopsis schrenkii]